MACCVVLRSVLQPSSIRWLATPRTYFLHLSLSSVILTDSSTGSPVHVLMLSIQAVNGLPPMHTVLSLPVSVPFFSRPQSAGRSHPPQTYFLHLSLQSLHVLCVCVCVMELAGGGRRAVAGAQSEPRADRRVAVASPATTPSVPGRRRARQAPHRPLQAQACRPQGRPRRTQVLLLPVTEAAPPPSTTTECAFTPPLVVELVHRLMSVK